MVCLVCLYNAKKSHCLVIGPCRNLDLPAVSINGLYLSMVDIGIIISKGKHFNVDFSGGSTGV
jgi:hypothetical protein